MVVQAGRTAKNPVQVGLQGSDEIEIVEGLDERAVVVTLPDGVELGAKVQIEAN
jgi:hypothetical protein